LTAPGALSLALRLLLYNCWDKLVALKARNTEGPLLVSELLLLPFGLNGSRDP